MGKCERDKWKVHHERVARWRCNTRGVAESTLLVGIKQHKFSAGVTLSLSKNGGIRD